MISRLPVAVMALCILASPASAGEAGAEDCITEWGVAAPIVKAEGLLSVEQLFALARAKLSGEIVKTTLCNEDGRYVFRIVVRGAKGQLRTLSLDARKPF